MIFPNAARMRMGYGLNVTIPKTLKLVLIASLGQDQHYSEYTWEWIQANVFKGWDPLK